MYLNIISFFKSFSFFKGILKTIAVVVPIGLGWYFDALEAGVAVGVTIIAISPSDIPGNRKHHIGGILMATFLAMLSSFFINISHPYPYVMWLAIFGLTFVNAYISLYGFRASMVAFSGLFSIASTLSHLQIGTAVLWHLFYIFLGGLWYILLVLLYLKIKPRQYSEQLLGKCFLLTADFFSVRAGLLLSKNRTKGFRQMIDLQTALNENYEKLREEILDSRSKSGKTEYLQRQFLMFIELVDIFELALANPVPYEKIDAYFEKNELILRLYHDFLTELSSQLCEMATYIGHRQKVTLNNRLKYSLLQAKNEVERLKNAWQNPIDAEKLLIVRNFYIYIENQYNSVENIRIIFENYYLQDIQPRDVASYRKFVSYQNYSWKRLKDHLSLKSSFFRHSVRLSVTALTAYFIGDCFAISNAYWIVLTVFIIMRPGFGLTKERSLSRIYGTILGGAVAFTLIYFFSNPNLYLFVGIFTMPIAFGLMQENYMYASVFITISAVFMFALASPDVYLVLHDRLLDTAIGVGLAFVANYLILPTWEHRTYRDAIQKSMRANVAYLQQVKSVFNEQEEFANAYKIARKEAFLALSNLNSTFQRMMQEPKSKQIDKVSAYGVIVIQQSFLASVASLGVRLKSRKTTFPEVVFNQAISILIDSLDGVLQSFSVGENPENFSLEEIQQKMKENLEKRAEKAGQSIVSMREIQLFEEQFNYLLALIKNLRQTLTYLYPKDDTK
ncbi:FUSC family membrane protein [Capnocytophaga sp.]|uniref:FUSC family protein n=1 Tax=Capnocytophaga sp. TaxID=44737 RepID=UPI0026DAD679|nr:FUSC family membrane protein [Capnocytophaga sp.]MDO5106187.1 FUSC family membrane protein [Capnocytophaga sp.]